MPKVLIRREGGHTIEISDLTFEQVKELAGVNGHAPQAAAPAPAPRVRRRIKTNGVVVETNEPDIHGFVASLPDRGRLFIAALREHPDGIDADALTGMLKLNNP